MGPTLVKQPFSTVVYVSKLSRLHDIPILGPPRVGGGWVLTSQFCLLMNGCLFSLDITFYLVHGLTFTNFIMVAAGIVAQCSFHPCILDGFSVEKLASVANCSRRENFLFGTLCVLV